MDFNERTCFFIKIYLSYFILERVDVGYVWEVSWRRRETATYWPQVPLTIAALLPHSAALLNQGHWGPKLCLELVLTPRASYFQLWLELWLELQLPQAVCGTWLYNWHPPASCGHTHLHRIQPRPQVKVIFRHLNWQLGWGSICNILIHIFFYIHELI